MRISLLLLLLFGTYMPTALMGQNDLKKCMRKLKLDSSQVAFSKEKVIMYPRGFIYATANLKVVQYLGCFSTDIHDFNQYVENSQTSITLESNDTIIRQLAGYYDTIAVLSLNNQLANLKTFSGEPLLMEQANYDFIVVYFFDETVIDRYLKRNFRHFVRYAKRNPQKKIKIIGVTQSC
ncbi:MAG: hypothetical protein ACFB10_14705 [Salibacteraceae bacterium]